MRETDLLARLLADLRSLSAEDRAYALPIVARAFRHPCVLWQAETNTGFAALGDAFPEAAIALAGTEYRSKDFVHASGTGEEGDAFAVAVVECPKAAECALAPICPREHYSVYAQLYGLGEFVAVKPSQLYQARPLGVGGIGAAHRSSPNGGVWSTARAAWRSLQKADPRGK